MIRVLHIILCQLYVPIVNTRELKIVCTEIISFQFSLMVNHERDILEFAN